MSGIEESSSEAHDSGSAYSVEANSGIDSDNGSSSPIMTQSWRSRNRQRTRTGRDQRVREADARLQASQASCEAENVSRSRSPRPNAGTPNTPKYGHRKSSFIHNHMTTAEVGGKEITTCIYCHKYCELKAVHQLQEHILCLNTSAK